VLLCGGSWWICGGLQVFELKSFSKTCTLWVCGCQTPHAESPHSKKFELCIVEILHTQNPLRKPSWNPHHTRTPLRKLRTHSNYSWNPQNALITHFARIGWCVCVCEGGDFHTTNKSGEHHLQKYFIPILW
jgi:hypothetical protein